MNELFKLFGTISINGAQAEDELAKVNGSAESTGSKIQSIFQGIAQGVGMYLGQMALNGVHQIGQFMSGVDEASGSMKSFASNMTLAGQSSAQIKQAQSAMESYAQATVYNTTDMLQTVGLLSTSGVQNATDLAKAMGNISSAAKDPEQALKSISLQMTQVNGKGFIQTMDFRIMQEQASGPMKMVQEDLEKLNGWSPAQFQAHLSDGSISADMFNKSLMDVGGESTKTGQLLEKNAMTPKTFGQAFAVVTESLQNKLIPVMEKLQNIFIPMISGLANLAGSFSNVLGNAISGVIDWITKLWGQLSNNGAISWFQNAFLNVKVIISQVGVILGQFFDSISGGKSQKQVIDDIAGAFKNVGKFINDVTGSMADFFQWFILGGSDVDVFKAAVVAVVGALATYKVVTGTIQAIESARNAILAIQNGYMLAQFVRTEAMTGAQAANAAATLGASGAFNIFNAVLSVNPIGLIITAIAALVAGLVYFFTQTTLGKQIWSDFMSWLQSSWQSISTFFSGLWNSITNIFSTSINAISNVVKTVFNAIKTVISDVWNVIKDIIVVEITIIAVTIGTALNIWNALVNFAMDGIKTAISAVWNWISPFIMPILDGIVNGLSIAWNTVSSVTSTVWNAIMSFLSVIVNLISNSISTAWNSILNVVSTVWNAITSVTQSVWNAITSVISGAVNGAWNVINNVFNTISSTISSVINGIKGTVSSVFNAIKDAMTTPINAAKDVISGIVNAIKGFFNFQISFPHIPLPHFGINPRGWQIGDLLKGSIPSLAVNWYAKGGIMTDPTMFGMNGDNPMVGGEAGPEAILPLNDKTYGGIAKGISEELNTSGILEKLDQVLQAINNKDFNPQIVMDNDTLVGQIINDVDKKMGSRSDLRGRSIALWD